MTIADCQPGQRVRVLQTVERRERDWHAAAVGVIQSIELQKTGSWFAHSKDDRFWLRRIKLVKDDGEESILVVDPLTEVELLESAPARP